MPSVRAFGYIPSPKDKVGLGHPGHILGAMRVQVLPPSAAVPLGPVVDQGIAPSCVGNSIAVALQAAAGPPWEVLPARRWIWTMGRLKAGQNPLQWEGTFIHSAMEAVSQLGFPPESACPYSEDPTVCNTVPTWEANRQAIDQRYDVQPYRIMTEGYQRLLDVITAIAAGHCVIWGTFLDQAFCDIDAAAVWPGMRGANVGGHAMILHSYTTGADSRRRLATRSSWAASFADRGSAWIDENAVMSSDASDFWIAQAVPRFPATVGAP